MRHKNKLCVHESVKRLHVPGRVRHLCMYFTFLPIAYSFLNDKAFILIYLTIMLSFSMIPFKFFGLFPPRTLILVVFPIFRL